MKIRQDYLKQVDMQDNSFFILVAISCVGIIFYLMLSNMYSFDDSLSRLLAILLGMSAIVIGCVAVVNSVLSGYNKEISEDEYKNLNSTFSPFESAKALLINISQERGLISYGVYKSAEKIRQREIIGDLLKEAELVDLLRYQQAVTQLEQREKYFGIISAICFAFAFLSLFILGHVLLLFWPEWKNLPNYHIGIVMVCTILPFLAGSLLDGYVSEEISLSDYTSLIKKCRQFPHAFNALKDELDNKGILDIRAKTRLSALIKKEEQAFIAQDAISKLSGNCSSA